MSHGNRRITLGALYERDRGVCGICGRWGPLEAMNRDHVVPLAKGGAHAKGNIRLAHIECNSRRGDDHTDVTGWRRKLMDLRERMTK